jgi:serine protease Do
MTENDENRSLYSYSKDEIHQDEHVNSRTTSNEQSTQNNQQPQYEQNAQQSQYGQENQNQQSGTYQNGFGESKINGASTQQTDTRFQSRAERRKNRPKKDRNLTKTGNVGKFVGKCVAAGLIFGLVSSLTFSAVNGLQGGKDTTTASTSGINKSSETTLLSTASGDSSSSTTTASSTTALDVSGVVSSVMPSIVSINSTFESEGNYFGSSGEYSGAGSGIIVAKTDSTMFIATNNHVVSGATKVTVNFYGDEDNEVEGEIKGTDSSNDLAVLSVKLSDIPSDTLENLKVATLGDSDSVKVGETAIAIGNALGYGQSVTTGVISALNRKVTIDNETFTLMQTDAAINPGNSGGALLNAKGEVIAINSAKFSDTQVEGMGYAIPISTAIPIINELIQREEVTDDEASYLGIAGIDVSDSVSEAYGMPEGVYISQVVDGAAAKNAGVQEGDVLTEFDGHTITSMSDLQELMKYYAAGTKVEIKVERAESGQYTEKTLTVTLDKKPDSLKNSSSSSDDSSNDSNSSNDNSNSNRNSGGYSFGR